MKSAETTRPNAAFFDLDLTITNRDSFRYYLRQHYLSNWQLWPFLPWIVTFGVLRKFRLVSLQTFKEKSLISLTKKNETHIKAIGEDFFLSNLKKTIRKKAYEKVQFHKGKGDLVFIISASPDIYVHSISDHLGCDGYFCTELAYSDGKFRGKFQGNDSLGPEKINTVKKIAKNYALELAECYAYSDHHSDLPLLKCVGQPVAITPTHKLREIALSEGWPIEDW